MELGIAAEMDPKVASARMNQYERDTHVPDFPTVKKIAKALDRPVLCFYTEDDLVAEILHDIDKLDRSGLKALRDDLKQKVSAAGTVSS